MSRVRSPPPALTTSDASVKLSSVKTEERLEARRLRGEEGLSMKDIARFIGVSLSSVSLWVRDIDLDDVQHASLRCRAARRRGEATAARARAVRREAQERGREQARRSDPLHMAGVMLFWAEGDKQRNSVRLANSDPDLLRLFVAFLRHCYGAEVDRTRSLATSSPTIWSGS